MKSKFITLYSNLMSLKVTVLYLLFFVQSISIGQNDSISNSLSLDDFFTETEEAPSLLPEKMLITQRVLWGNKGLMRNFSYFDLTAENRQRELNIRRYMLSAHQILGFVTLGGMIAQGFVGAKLYTNNSYKDIHENLGAGVNISYFTTASLSLFAPPKMFNERKGLSSIKIHKYLSVLHLSTMILTNILAEPAADNPIFKPYHRAASFTAFGSFAASIIVITF